MPETLSLIFPELPVPDRTRELAPVLRKLERMATTTVRCAPFAELRRVRPNSPDSEQIDAKLRKVLAARGIFQLYSHQAEACNRIAAAQNVVIVTPTASGKTLCYNLPVLNRLIADPGARALYLIPDQGSSRRPTRRTAQPGRERARLSARSLTTAIRRKTPAAPSASAPTLC